MPTPKTIIRAAVISLLLAWSATVQSGGGVVLSEDTCIITIGFYEAHFTAYQPAERGDEQFCEDLPAVGETIFVLDYLHRSLSEVPVDFRVIRNVTGKGEFARWEDVQALGDLDAHTVFYEAPVVKRNATFQVTVPFSEAGNYVGIVTAGHPSKDTTYASVFPFSVGRSRAPWGLLGFAAVLAIAAVYVVRTLGGRRGGAA